jgi:putative ABC transport system permease protein
VSPLRFVLSMAWRESRASRGTLLLLVAAVALGSAALVAIRGFADGVRASVSAKARELLGADLVAGAGAPFSAAAEARLAALLADAEQRGGEPPRVARVVSFGSMALVAGGERTRLAQVLAVDAGHPFYGAIETEPAGLWPGLAKGGAALVDPSLLVSLGAKLGDALQLGEARFEIAGVVTRSPGDVGVRSALGPRIYIPRHRVEETGLLGYGARARYETYVALPASVSASDLAEHHRPALAAERLWLRTVTEDQRRLDANLGRLGRYLSLVGLAAVLLAGIGVASAVHVLVRRRLQTVAVLRCLGASSRRVLAVSLAQAVGLGLLGSALGALLGAALATLLPRFVRGLFPVEIEGVVTPGALGLGLAVGTWTAFVFTLLPVLAVREVSPLAALRREYEAPLRRRSRSRAAVLAFALASVVVLAMLQAGSAGAGLAFGVGILATLGLLGAAAALLRSLLRRVVSPGLPYVWRQGLANLHRPQNQTLAVVLALGFGAFLLGVLLVLQHNLLRDLRRDGETARPNLALFDVQPDQLDAVLADARRAGARVGAPVPIVSMRVASIKGVPVGQRLAQSAAGSPDSGPGWVLRREYRSTYKDALGAAEEIVAGRFWEAGEWSAPEAGAGATHVPVSLEVEVAKDLGVGLGDEIVWDVQGMPFASRVTSLRKVEWARFEPNFFAVFPKGPLDEAPQTLVALARLDDATARARLERGLVLRFPNVSSLDLADVQRTIEEIIDRVALAVRFMAGLSMATGLVVLLGAVATGQQLRMREAALLKALGATRRQVLRVVLAEYASLGVLAAASGLLLAAVAGSALVRYTFETSVALPAAGLGALGLGIAALVASIGVFTSASVFRRTPLEVLRAE